LLTLSDRTGVAPCFACSAVLRGTVRAIARAFFILSYLPPPIVFAPDVCQTDAAR